MSAKKSCYALGKWIVDYIKDLDHFPQRNKLTPIRSEQQFGGGGAFNVLMNLSLINDADVALYALGSLGDDDAAAFILAQLDARGINTSLLNVRNGYRTPYTIVLAERDQHTRTFLFCDSAVDSHYCAADIHRLATLNLSDAIFYIGYLNIIEGLFTVDGGDNILLVDLLRTVKKRGGTVVGDCVSLAAADSSIDLKKLIDLTFPLIDFLVMNEVELEIICCRPIRDDKGRVNLVMIAEEMLKFRQLGTGSLIVHFPEGAYILTATELLYVESYPVDADKIVGTLGAGDAFCSGVINAVMQGKTASDILKEGHAMAMYNLKCINSVFMNIDPNEIKELVAV